MERVFVFTVWKGGRALDYATVLPPEMFTSLGAVGEAIVGTLVPSDTDGTLSVEAFTPNENFAQVLQHVVAEHAPGTEGFRAEAARVLNGWVYVVDRRTPTPQGPVPPEDIIGGFRVEGGQVVGGSYIPNPRHRLLTERGFFHLEDALHQQLVAELASRATKAG